MTITNKPVPSGPTGVIYVLRDPETRSIRYVGQTTKPLRIRLSSHKSYAKVGNSPLCQWIRSLPQPPIIDLLIDEIPALDLNRVEREAIVDLQQRCDLVNARQGGTSPNNTRGFWRVCAREDCSVLVWVIPFDLKNNRKRFCSLSCANYGRSVERSCEVCGTCFKVKRSELQRPHRRGRFCSKKCYGVGKTHAT
jgi:hypothetical protein